MLYFLKSEVPSSKRVQRSSKTSHCSLFVLGNLSLSKHAIQRHSCFFNFFPLLLSFCYFLMFVSHGFIKFTGGDSEKENGRIVKGDIIKENGGRV